MEDEEATIEVAVDDTPTDPPTVDVTVSAEDLTKSVIEGAAIYSELTDSFMENFVFYEKTLVEWAHELTIEIPESRELTPILYREVLLKIAHNYQRASNYYSIAVSLSKTFEGGAEIKKNDVVAAIVNTFNAQKRKRPAGTIVERMADSYMRNTVSSRVAAGLVRDFWKQRLDTFEMLRKTMEQIGMSLNVELKHTSTT